MNRTREAYLQVAPVAAALLRDPAVAAGWGGHSALPEFQVSGLAGHLARQVINVPGLLAQPAPDEPPLSLMDHYARSSWVGAEVGSDVNAVIRRGGEETAAEGPVALASRVEAVVEALPAVLAAEPAHRAVHLPWAGWALSLDDFLATRMLEIVVHVDDLAVSVGVATPSLPEAPFEEAVTLLTRLAARRHGQPAVVRALSRAERAPNSIAAI